VIADGHGVDADGAHREHHRIGRRVVARVVDVRERRTLNGIARVQQQRARRILFANLPHERRDLRQPARVRLSRVVVDRQDVAVQIRRREDREPCVLWRRRLTGRMSRQ
jgi:hypothetical protein